MRNPQNRDDMAMVIVKMFRLEFLYQIWQCRTKCLWSPLYVSPFFSWFAGAMTRDEADEALKDEKDNTYLVRYIVVILLTLIYSFK